MESLTLKLRSSFQNLNNGKATNSFAPRRLISNLPEEEV